MARSGEGVVLGGEAISSAEDERGLVYRALFEAMSEGFALVEPIWGEEGRLADYRIVEVNPALLAMLGTDQRILGQKLSDGGAPAGEWLRVCDRAMRSGEPVSFEYHNRQTQRWHEIRLTRVSDTRLAQFFFDVTERKAALAHQERLFDELNHRVKNSLAMVSGLLTVQARRAPKPAREHLARAVSRVEAIAEVHGALIADGPGAAIDFAAYLRTLCGRLAASLTDGTRVRIAVEAKSAELSLEDATALGMIVNELVTNAVKHAYPDPARGVIRVRFGPDDGGLVLEIADDGPGPAPLGARSKGLGVRLVDALVKQLGAGLRVSGPPGAHFEVRLPA